MGQRVALHGVAAVRFQGGAHELRIGTGGFVDHLVDVAHAAEEAAVAGQQGLQQSEHGLVHVVHFIHHEHFDGLRPVGRVQHRLPVVQQAGQVVGGILRATEGGFFGVGAADALKRQVDFELGVFGANAVRVVGRHSLVIALPHIAQRAFEDFALL